MRITPAISKTLFTLLLTFTLFSARGADFSVKGLVTDSIGEPEPYATVKIYAKDNQFASAAADIADIGGRFDITLDNAGDYVLRVTAVGKNDAVREFSVTTAAPTADLGTIVMSDNATALNEVVVSAQRPIVSKEIDRIGYDVQADEQSKTSPVIDILRKVPLVVVQPDGTILVNGSSNYKIYRNGRPNASYSQNAKELFKSIPASTIKKIEVITDPGAREDAEGVGAILNIVTMENTALKGVSGNLSAASNTIDYYPSNYSAFLTTQIDKFTISPYVGVYNSTRRKPEESETNYVYQATGDRMTSTGTTKNKFGHQYWGFDSSLELDTLNLITLEYSGTHFKVHLNQDESLDMVRPDGGLIYRYDTHLYTPISQMSHTLAANYQRSTRRPGETVTLSYQFSSQSGDNTSEYTYSDMVNFPMPYTGMTNVSTNSTGEHTVQVDWSRPYGKVHKLDLGAKYIDRRAHSLTDIEYVGVGNERTEFAYTTQVGAAYADYRAKFGSLGVRGGVRYEFSRLGGEYKSTDQPAFSSTFSDLVPNVAVNYDINDANTIKLSYGLRISRPGIQSLNPAVVSAPNTVSYGNPDLKSARYNGLVLNYSLMKPRFNMDLTGSYNFNNNGIERVMFTKDNIIYGTYENIGHTRRLGMSFYAQWMISEKSSLSFNGSVSHARYEIPDQLTGAPLVNSGWNGYGDVRFVQRLPWKLRATVGLSYWSGGLMGAYTSYSMSGAAAFDHDISLQRSFLKDDRLTVQLSVQNPFGPYSPVTISEVLNAGIEGTQREVMHQNCAGQLRVSFRFGTLQAYVKKAKGISNDDAQATESKGKGN